MRLIEIIILKISLSSIVVVADRKKNKGDGIDGELSVCLVLGPDATMQLEKEGSKSGEIVIPLLDCAWIISGLTID